MLKEEAQWVGAAVRALPDHAFPMLNLGCQTAGFREVEQPWIEEEILAPLRFLRRPVVHVDMRGDHGVDLVADLTTADGCLALAATSARTLLCSNVLEHVADVDAALASLRVLTPSSGYLILTGPERYPWHPDPIDNGLRPSWQEMADRCAPWFEVVDGARIHGLRMVHRYLSSRGRRASDDADPFTNPAPRRRLLRPARFAERLVWAPRRPVAFAVILRRTEC